MHEVKLDNISVLWYGHASFRITNGKKIINIDPYVLPNSIDKADIVLVTHDHFDHCDANNTSRLRKDGTSVFGAASAVRKLGFGSAMSVGKKITIDDIAIEAVEAYNTNKFRAPGQPFHPRGLGVGFVIETGGKRIYHAGDTDNIKEMASLKNIDLALLPIGGTYTMTVDEAAEAAKIIKPQLLAPMHYNSDKYGVSGINANPLEFQMLLGKGIGIVLEPLV